METLETLFQPSFILLLIHEVHNHLLTISSNLKDMVNIWVGPDIRPFSIFGRIPDIEAIRITDIRLISKAGYPVVRLIAGYPALARYPA